MHVKAKTLAFGGLLLALTVVFMALGSVIETSTLFLLAAASFFVGIVIREFGLRIGAVFYIAAVLLGLITAPNKFYVFTFAAMGFYIWGIEAVWRWLEKRPHYENRLLFGRTISDAVLIGVLAGGQIGLFIYDKAYEYVQAHMWGKLRGRMIG